MRVLLVEDQAKLALTVATGLRREGMAVDTVFDGRDALAHTASTDYDVIVLDRDIPGVHGDEVCRQLGVDGCTSRVLMLTAAGTIRTVFKVSVSVPMTTYPNPSTSPSSWLEFERSLAAPIQPYRRRWSAETSNSTRPTEVASRGGHRLALSPKEFAVLEPSSAPAARWFRRRSFLSASGTRRLIRSAKRSRPRSAGCASSSGIRRLSRQWPSRATGSVRADASDCPNSPTPPRRSCNGARCGFG